MKHIRIALILSVFVIPMAKAEIAITNPVAKDIGQSYGFYLGQKRSLKKISGKFPNLAGLALLAEKEFYTAFGDSINEMDETMSRVAPAEWQNIKAGLEKEIAEMIASFQQTQNEAERFIQTVRSRAKGDIPSPIIETLLMFKPRHQKNPVSEFLDGYKQRHEYDGSGKSKGVEFSLEVPRSWEAMEGDRPNIVAKFFSENGRGLEGFLVLIKTVPLEPGEEITAADISEIINPKDMADMLPKGARYLSSGEITLETLPGYWARFDISITRGRQSINVSSIMYTIFYKNRMIQMQGQVATPGSESNDLGAEFNRFEKLFDLIAQSLVLPGIYSQ